MKGISSLRLAAAQLGLQFFALLVAHDIELDRDGGDSVDLALPGDVFSIRLFIGQPAIVR